MKKEQSICVEVEKLKQFSGYTFQLHEGEEMEELIESIASIGIVTPVIVRPLDDGYEIVSGHRRVHAAKRVGLATVPVIIKDMNYDEAVILMVDSNVTRACLLPSEKAFGYKAKLDALKRQGKRTDLTFCQDGKKYKYRADNLLAEESTDSSRNIHRYIRLTYLIPELLEQVDAEYVSFTPAIELSHLTQQQQEWFCSAMKYADCPPSLSQAQRIRKLSQMNQVTMEAMLEILSEEKKVTAEKVVIKYDEIRRFFPANCSSRDMQKKIIQLLEDWNKKV